MKKGLDTREREYLNYRPRLGFTPKILSTVNPEDNYVVPPAIDTLAEVLPSSILDEINNLLLDVKVLGERMAKCLQDDVAEGVSFKDYSAEKRKAHPNFDMIKKYENYHTSNINGKVQAEVYPMLLDMESELSDYRDFLNKQFFNGNANYEYMDTVKEKEKAELEKYIEEDMKNPISDSLYNKLETKAQLSRYALDRVENAKNFVKDLNGVLCSTVNQYYNGHVRNIVNSLATAPLNVLEDFNKMNQIKFKQSAEMLENDKNRQSKLNTKEMKSSMNEVMQKISDMKVNGRENLLSWVKTLDTDFDQSPVTMLITDALDRIEFVDREYENTMLELYKHNKLDELLKQDMISSMIDKKQSRQVHNLISEIVKERQNNTFEVDKFISDKKLELPGTLCTS